MNFCVQCKHHMPSVNGGNALCAASQYKADAELDLVTGETLKPWQKYWPCSDARGVAGKCGADSKLFQPKEGA